MAADDRTGDIGDDSRLLGTADETDLEVEGPHDHAAGLTAVKVAMQRSLSQMGPSRTARTLLRLNQPDGFDCMSCAWPDPDPEHRHRAEFCENGAKAVAEEATKARLPPAFFARKSVAENLSNESPLESFACAGC